MEVVIFGSRHLQDREALDAAMEMARLLYGIVPTSVISGRERTGMDAVGEAWAGEHGLPVHAKPADWVRFPRLGGRKRNVEMSRIADAGVGVVLRGGTPGSLHMASLLTAQGKPCYVVEVDG